MKIVLRPFRNLAHDSHRTLEVPSRSHCRIGWLAGAWLALVIQQAGHAAPPPGILNHQGRIAVSGENFTGTGHFKFALVNAAGTVRYWSNNNSGTGGGQPTAAVQVPVSQGHYALGLGDAGLANMTVIPATVFSDNTDVRLRIWFSTNGSTFEQLTPDRRITSAGYALSAATVTDAGVARLTGNQTFTGTVNAPAFTGSGTGLSGVAILGASNTFSGNQNFGGTVNATAFVGNGGSLTGVAKLSGGNAFTGNQTINGIVTVPLLIGPAGAALALGSTGAQPVELSAGGFKVLRLLPGAAADEPNLIGGSSVNTIGAGTTRSVIGGGGGPAAPNSILAGFNSATIAGGSNNTAGESNATVGGGTGNTAAGNSATVAGGEGNKAEIVRATVGGGYFNTANNDSATVGGGYQNVSSGDSSTVSGGWLNKAVGGQSAVGGGYNNVIAVTAERSVIAGGSENEITEDDGAIGGGYDNTVSGDSGTVAGGWLNAATGVASAIGGGYGNTAAGVDSMIPGGFNCSATGSYSFAAGTRAKALHFGSWVWGDGQDVDFASTGNNQFLIRASGNVGINKNNPASTLDVNGTLAASGTLSGGGTVIVDAANANTGNFNSGPGLRFGSGTSGEGLFSKRTTGSNQFGLDFTTNFASRLSISNGGTVSMTGTCIAQSFVPTSDRNAKENFASVDPLEVLEKVAALPITRWNFKTDTEVAHIGPMAQDFHAAFHVGPDDRHIATVDADGVALAAIQGLNRKVEEGLKNAGAEQNRDLADMEEKVAVLSKSNALLVGENTALKQRLERLENAVAALAAPAKNQPAAAVAASASAASAGEVGAVRAAASSDAQPISLTNAVQP
ncbi:MAG: hypothetical protein JWL81_1354 [Verrucomicrobiales bacterium]|nr:hypothetical protein [Verrucomicrobiales bacterium]